MDRVTVYTGETVRSVDFLNGQRNGLIGLGGLFQALFGTTTAVDGLACVPGAGLTVSLGAGQIFSQAAIDTGAYSTLTADAHLIMKQGRLADAAVLSTPAPGTAGQSIAYLVEVQLQETDTDAVLLPFYNSAAPTVPWSGPGGGGTPSSTARRDLCAVQIKAGTAAATGTQVTPTVDVGWTALWVVTVANGATGIVSGNIAAYPGAPFINPKLAALGALAGLLLNSNTTITQGGTYLLDTTLGAFNVTLPVAPARPCYLTFIDAKLTWKTNPPVLLLGGASLFNPVTGAVIPGDLTLNVKGLTWTMFWDGTYWSAC
jgi:hypothetical protein